MNKAGMNWISKDKRLAIYLRDGMGCMYCGSTLEDGITLTLDHLTPRSRGGDNEATNLITCCSKCNSVRGDRILIHFADTVAAYINHGVAAEMILAHIAICASRDLAPFRQMAKEIMSLRPSWSEALRLANGE